MSDLEEQFLVQLKELPAPTRQYMFGKELKRQWRADFCWPDLKLIVEVQGGIYRGSKGGHTSITGYNLDSERMCYAQLLGYDILYITPTMIKNRKGAWFVKEWFRRFANSSIENTPPAEEFV